MYVTRKVSNSEPWQRNLNVLIILCIARSFDEDDDDEICAVKYFCIKTENVNYALSSEISFCCFHLLLLDKTQSYLKYFVSILCTNYDEL